MIFAAITLLLANLAIAQEQESAGITPDSVFYGLDKALESIRLALTFDHVNKAELHLKYANERLAEAQKVIEKNDLKHLERLMKDMEKELNETTDEISKAKSQGKDVDAVVQRVEEATSKHTAVLQGLLDKVPENARDNIQHAIEMSSKSMIKAMESVNKTEERPKPKEGEKPKLNETKVPSTPEQRPAATQPESKPTEAGTGRLNVQLTDKKPGSLNITGLVVTLSDIKVHIAGNGSTSDEVCVNNTYTSQICNNETIPKIMTNCVNETIVKEVCTNETINGTTTEICSNQTVVQETCTNQTINETVTVCNNSTNTVENCTIQNEAVSGWFTVVQGPLTFDLIKIEGVKEFLGSKELDAGVYTQIRLNVNEAKLYISGQEKPLKVPSSTIKLVNSFKIESGKTTTLTLDFDAEESVHQAGSQYIMRPTIKVIEGP